MENNIKVTIATVVFNADSTISETIESVINQSYKNIQYIIVDGASTDNTLKIVQRYANCNSIIKCTSEPDNGIYDAINKAQQIATGEFLLFLGSDDTLYNNTVIENFVKLVKDINSVYYGDVFTSITKDFWAGFFTAEKLILQNICHQAVFYPKCVYKKFAYNLKYKLYADWDYNLRVWSEYGDFKRIELTVTLYAQTGSTGNNNTDKVFLKDRTKLVKQYFGSKYGWLIKMQRIKVMFVGKTDLRKFKGFLFNKLK